jgi:hypothetical protein
MARDRDDSGDVELEPMVDSNPKDIDIEDTDDEEKPAAKREQYRCFGALRTRIWIFFETPTSSKLVRQQLQVKVFILFAAAD